VAVLTLLLLVWMALPASAQVERLPVPVITDVKPAVVKPGDRIVIRGRAFKDLRSVSVAGLRVPVTSRSANRITVKAPPNAGRGPVSVATAGGVAVGPR